MSTKRVFLHERCYQIDDTPVTSECDIGSSDGESHTDKNIAETTPSKAHHHQYSSQVKSTCISATIGSDTEEEGNIYEEDKSYGNKIKNMKMM